MAILVEQWADDGWAEVARYTVDDGARYREKAREFAQALSNAKGMRVRVRFEGAENMLDLFENGVPQPHT